MRGVVEAKSTEILIEIVEEITMEVAEEMTR